ncbi:MAG: hypothetical protein IJI59_16605, partial [Clostridia bacterium]|nr:hypothetical protein [Clostridia bacterium]
ASLSVGYRNKEGVTGTELCEPGRQVGSSFDQEGVQLGKVLAKRVLAHDTDGALKAYSDLLNI